MSERSPLIATEGDSIAEALEAAMPRQVALPGYRLNFTLGDLKARLPAELIELRRWVAWKWELRDGDWTKPPVNVHTGARASATDPKTWATFDRAMAYHEREPRSAGVGFVISDSGFFGVDLDDCRDPETGELTPDAAAIVRELGTWGEVSARDRGIHLIGRGKLPPGRRRRGWIEAYDSGRYFTMTGHLLAGAARAILDRQDALNVFHARWLADPSAPPASRATPKPSGPTDLGDSELIEHARRAKNGEAFTALWDGDTSRYDGDDSRADLALLSHLAFWTGHDAERMDRLFRQSGLMRPKWEQRPDYRERTISKALEGCDDSYSGGQPSAHRPLNGSRSEPGPQPWDDAPPWEPGPDESDFGAPDPEEPGGGSAGAGAEGEHEVRLKEFQTFDAHDRAEWPCKDIEWIIEPILARDHIAYDHSSPKTFKTFRALDTVFCTAHGIPWLGKYTTQQGRILYCANEDRLRRFKARLGEIETGYKRGPAPKGRLIFIPIRDQADPDNRRLDLTDLIDRGAIIRAGKGYDLIVLDMIAYMMGELDEDTKLGFSKFANMLREIQDATEAALYGVEHDRKGSPNPRQRSTEPDPQDMRGSGAKYGLVDLLISAKRPTDARRVIVRIENRDHDDVIKLGIEIAPRDSGELKIRPFDLEAAADMQRAKGAATSARVLEAVTLSPKTLKEIAQDAGDMPTTTAADHLETLEQEGLVQSMRNKTRDGQLIRREITATAKLYLLTETGHETKAASRETKGKPQNDT